VKRLVLAAAACAALLTGLDARAADAVPGPEEQVRELYRTFIDAVRAQRAAIDKDRSVLYAITERSTDPYVDYDRLSRLVLGRNWTAATPAQRERFMAEFRGYLVRTYAVALVRYIDAEFIFKPVQLRPGDRQVMVRTETVPQGGTRFPVNYLLYLNDHGWKALDVSIDGVSVVATLRAVVESEVREKGLDGVIEDLARKNREAG